MPRKKVAKKTGTQPLEVVRDEVVQPEVEPAPEAPQEQATTLDDLRCAYVSGITNEGDFIFELFGKDKGLVELLGVHQHACRRVEAVYDDKQLRGDRLVHEVGKAVALLNQKLDQVLNAVAPKQPDNDLS